MAVAQKRPLLSHPISLFTVAAVGAALLHTQFHPQPGLGFGGSWHYTSVCGLGWPARAVLRVETQQADSISMLGPTTWTTSTQYQWKAAGCIVDGAAALLILLSTIFVCERSRRRGWRFSIASLMLLAAVAAIVTVLYQNESAIVHYLNEIVHGIHVLREGFGEPPWYILAPLAVGVGSTVFAAGWLLIRSMRTLWAPFQQRKAYCGGLLGS